jgi:hypothetical protein
VADKEITALQGKIKNLERSLASSRGEVGRRNAGASADLTRVSGELARARSTIEELERRIEDAESRIADEVRARHETAQRHDRQISELRARYEEMDRRLRLQAGHEVAVLDARDDGLADLAAAVRRAADLRSHHLPDAERVRLKGRVDAWPARERARRDKRLRALALSARLAATPVGEAGHRAAAEGFRALRHELAELDADRDAARAEAEDAADRIAADDRLRGTDAPDLEAGVRAERGIHDVARQRVGDAVARETLFPQWFVSALGDPARGATGRWVEAAASLVAYRITYAIDDEVAALGPGPGPQWPAARRAWFGRLQPWSARAPVPPPQPDSRTTS